MSNDTKQKKKHIKAVRPKLRLFRAKEPLLSVLMWGINHSINELTHINVPVMLMPDDFKSHSKIKVDNHLFNKENMPSHFKFKEYCPLVFRNLRERFGISEDSYLDSLTKRPPLEAEDSGRSGSRFMKSHDGKFILKTISTEQVAEMHRILKDYHQYIVEHSSQTLLPRFLGMYRTTVNDNETYVIIFVCVFSPFHKIHRKYDLKGSRLAREASDKERGKTLPTLKDNDLLNDGTKVYLEPESREEFLTKLKSDVEFLSGQNLMDYSLLVGLHELDRLDDDESDRSATDSDEEPCGYSSGGGNTPPHSPPIPPVPHPFALPAAPPHRILYYLGLIDILTQYGMKKRSAAAAKTMKYGAGAEISTVHPDQYMKRFMDFIETVIQ